MSKRKLPEDKIEGYLEIGHNDRGEVILNLDRDRNGIGHLVFSTRQALNLAKLLRSRALLARKEFLQNNSDVKA